MWTWALARRLEGTGVTANAMHPGTVATKLLREAWGSMGGKSPAAGADTALWLAASREVEGLSGRFWIDRRQHPCRFRDDALEERLWSLCESMTAAHV